MATAKTTQKGTDVLFTHERDTKGAVRYKEDVENGGEMAIGTLYLRKAFAEALGDGKAPVNLKVTLVDDDS